MDKNPKKILIVCHHYPPHITGVGVIAHEQAKILVKRGCSVSVITSDTGEDEQNSMIDGVKVIRVKALNFLEKIHAPFPFFSPTIFYHLFKEVIKSDIVHIHDTFYLSSIFSFLIAKLLRKPIVLTQHIALISHTSKMITIIQKIVYSTYAYLIFRYSDIITVYNDTVQNFILDKGISNERIIRLTNGIDTDFYNSISTNEKIKIKESFGLNINKKTVLFVGRFVPKKGFEKVYNSQDEDYQIVFAGGDTHLKNTDKVVFLGKLSKDKIKKLYQASDLFVLPSVSEGFPVSIQEAMACGLPIITTNDIGYNSYNLDSTLFYLLDNPTHVSVKNSIKKILGSGEVMGEMSQYSREYAVANFDWDSKINELLNIYSSAIKRRNTKKIAFVSDAIYEFNKGGKEKRLYDITRKLSNSGFDVTVYCMKWWEGNNEFIKEGVRYVSICKYYPLYNNDRRSIKQAIIFSLSCLKLIFKKFDYIDVDHIPHLVLFTTKLACVLKRKKLIVTWHEVWGRNYWKKYLGNIMGEIAYAVEYISSKLPNKIVSVSDHTTKELSVVLGVNRNVFTIPNAIDLSNLKLISSSNDVSDVIFAGRMLPNKNIHLLLEAVKILKNKNYNLSVHIVGDGPELFNLKELSSKLNINDSVKFYGFIENHNDLYSLMKASKVFVLPSNREGFGIVVIEANACGLPVITVDVDGNASKDLIIQGENGYVCKFDSESIADTILVQLEKRSNPEYYVKYSDKYDWSNVYPKIVNLYK